MRILLFFLLLSFPFLCSAQHAWDAATWGTVAPSKDSLPTLERETADVRSLSDEMLYERALAETEFVSHSRPTIEWDAWRLAHLARLSEDAEAGRKAAVILSGLAARSTPPPPKGIHMEGKWIPYPAVIAFGLLSDKEVWSSTESGVEWSPAKKAVESWLRGYADSFVDLLERKGQVTNYTPFGLRHAAALALVIEDEALLRRCFEVANRLAFSPEFWYADLIWQEGTVSYALQVSGNLKSLLSMLRAGNEAGLAYYCGDAMTKLSERLEAIDQAQARFRMPSGRPVPVNDTHWAIPADSLPRAPRNIVFPDFGHFALAGNDIETHLSVPVLTGGGRYGGGHLHDSRLALQLWAHGEEVLPDAGYPFLPKNNRYFHMSPYAHNTSVALSKNATYPQGSYGVWDGMWARSSVVGYDDGRSSDGKITYIAATSVGPPTEKVTRAERQVIQVSTGEWSGYIVDAFWLQGGELHRSFLRQSEDEKASMETDASLVPVGPSMAAVLGEPEEGDAAWTSHLREPREIVGPDAFGIQWQGERSQVTLRSFLAPQAGSQTWLSEMPRLRPTRQNPEKRDDFPGWHLFRQREVAPEDLTLWAAVYEPVARGERAKLQAVSWHRAEGGRGIRVDVQLADRRDTWVLALPDEPAGFSDCELDGRAAGFSLRLDGQPHWKWTAAGTRIRYADTGFVKAGKADKRRVVELDAQGDHYEITVSGRMALPKGEWAALRFADGSGRAIYLDQVLAQNEEETRIQLKGDPGLRVDSEGMRRTTFPMHPVEGAVFLEPLGGHFEGEF